MLLNTFRAEFTKLRTTRSFWWTSGLFLLVAWGWAILLAAAAPADMGAVAVVNTALVPMGMQVIGFAILMIQAIMVVTTEYRYGLQMPGFLANPNRLQVAGAKFVLYAVVAAVLTFLGVVGAFLLADALAPELAAEAFDPFGTDEGQRILWVFPLAAALVVLFAQGLGWLLRQTAGAVAVALIFFLGLDNLIGFIPKVGDKLTHFSPFSALRNWMFNEAPGNAPWGDSVGAYGLVFLAWGLVLWLVGLVILRSRDA